MRKFGIVYSKDADTDLQNLSDLCGKTIDELDMMDTRAVNQFFEEEKPQYVILAAAKVGGIVDNSTYRGQFIYENLMIQNNVIHAAYLNKAKKLLFLGSTCIYPRDAPQPMAEDCLLTSPWNLPMNLMQLPRSPG